MGNNLSDVGGLLGEVSRRGTLNESYRMYKGQMII